MHGGRIAVAREGTVERGNYVLLRGDNEEAVQWVRRCRGGKEPRSGALMRFLGVLEMSSEHNFDALRVPGVLNDIADGISRWKESSVLASSSSETPLRHRLSTLTKGISVRG